METMIAPISELEAKADGKTGIVTAYAAVFNSRDNGQKRDMLLPGCFKKSLEEEGKQLVYLPSHDYGIHVADIPAVPITVREDRNGLWTETKFFLETQKGRDSFTVIDEYQKAGRPLGLSFTFKAEEFDIKAEGRNVKRVTLKEYGHTAIPMHPDARTLSTKSALLLGGEALEEFKGYYSSKEHGYLVEQGLGYMVKNAYGDESCIAVVTPSDLYKAVYYLQSGDMSGDDIKQFVIGRAKAMGYSDDLPKSWTAKGSKSDEDPGETSKPDKEEETKSEEPTFDLNRFISMGQQLDMMA